MIEQLLKVTCLKILIYRQIAIDILDEYICKKAPIYKNESPLDILRKKCAEEKLLLNTTVALFRPKFCTEIRSERECPYPTLALALQVFTKAESSISNARESNIWRQTDLPHGNMKIKREGKTMQTDNYQPFTPRIYPVP